MSRFATCVEDFGIELPSMRAIIGEIIVIFN